MEADFLGFGSSQEAAEEAFMPESPNAGSSQGFAAASQSPYPSPPGSQSGFPGQSPKPETQAATPDGLADFFSAPSAAAAPASSSVAEAQSSTAHIDDMFSAGPRPNISAPRPAAASPSSSSGGVSSRHGQAGGGPVGSRPVPKPVPKAAPTSMIDFGDEAALLAEHPDLYKGLEEVAGQYDLFCCVCLSVCLHR